MRAHDALIGARSLLAVLAHRRRRAPSSRGASSGPAARSLAVAVVPPEEHRWRRECVGGQQFARVLSRDLELSGYFRVLDPRTFVEDAAAGVTRRRDRLRRLGGHRRAGAREGHHRGDGDTVTVEVRLFDVAERRDVARRRAATPGIARRPAAAGASLCRPAARGAHRASAVPSTRRSRSSARAAVALKDVYVYTFDMTAPARLTNERSITLSPSWRPDQPRHPLHVLPRAPAAALRGRPRAPRRDAVLHRTPGSTSAARGRPTARRCWRRARTTATPTSSCSIAGARWCAGSPTTGASTSRRPGRPTGGASRSARAAPARRRSTPWTLDGSGVRRVSRIGQLQHLAGVVAEGRLASRGRRATGNTFQIVVAHADGSRRARRSPAPAATRIRRGRPTVATWCSPRRAADGARCGSPIATAGLRNN